LGGSVRAFALSVHIDFPNATCLHRHGRKILKEVPFDFVLLRAGLQLYVERAASREEGAITNYGMLKNFYARFEDGTVEPICDDNADPTRWVEKSSVA
jgi:hypothetical protein